MRMPDPIQAGVVGITNSRLKNLVTYQAQWDWSRLTTNLRKRIERALHSGMPMSGSWQSQEHIIYELICEANHWPTVRAVYDALYFSGLAITKEEFTELSLLLGVQGAEMHSFTDVSGGRNTSNPIAVRFKTNPLAYSQIVRTLRGGWLKKLYNARGFDPETQFYAPWEARDTTTNKKAA